MAEWQRTLEQTKKEVREIRALEKQLKWSMDREEKKQKVEEKKQSEKEIRDWRWQQQDEMKQFVEAQTKDRHYKELGEQKEFQEWKRECKLTEKNEDIKYMQEAYRDSTDYAQWQAELAQSIQEEKKSMVLEHFEKYEMDRERKTQEKLVTKAQESEERNGQRQLEMDHMQRELAKEKEALLRSLEFTRSRGSVPVNTSATTKSTSRLL